MAPDFVQPPISITASAANAPWPAGIANTGFRSIEASVGPAATAKADRRDSISASAPTSAGGRPRAPCNSGAPLIAPIIAAATSVPNGQR